MILLTVVAVVVLVCWWHSNNEDRIVRAQADQGAAFLQGLLDLSRSAPPPHSMGHLGGIPPAPAFQPFQGPNFQTHRQAITINVE